MTDSGHELLDLVVRQKIERVVHILVEREYGWLARMTGEQRLTAELLREAIEGYGRTLVPLPEGWESDDRTLVCDVGDARHRALAVTLDFWTVEEGRSDLSLEMQLDEVRPGLWNMQIDNIHVL